eukprot:727393_1
MCGIFAIFARNIAKKYSKNQIYLNLMRIQQRGPDATKYLEINTDVHFGFHRLAINDTSCIGMQPFVHDVTNDNILKRIHDQNHHSSMQANIPMEENNHYIITQCNGEIYNAFELQKRFNFKMSSKSDCEIISHLYHYFKGDMSKVCQSLDGVFAFTLYDSKKNILHAARDPIGIRPLFIGKVSDDPNSNSVILASEAKSIIDFTANIQQLPLGSYWQSDNPNEFTKWFDICDNTLNSQHEVSDIEAIGDEITNEDNALVIIKDNLTKAVKKRLMSDRPIGSLLSGGVDSSLVSGLLNQYVGERDTINTYTVGMKDSPDIYYAQKVAEHIKSNHHTIEFTFEEACDSLHRVIFTLETYDVHMIRGAMALYFMGKYIKDKSNDVVIYAGIGE